VFVTPASPRFALAPALNVPPLIAIGPLKPVTGALLSALKVRVPVSVFVRLPVPESEPSTVRLFEPVTLKVAPLVPIVVVREALRLKVPVASKVAPSTVSAAPVPPVRYRTLPTTPSAWRDLNLLLGPAVGVAEVRRIVRQAGGALLEDVTIVSEFRSEQLGPEHRAVQVRLTVRAPDRTVRDEEVDGLVARVLKAVEKQLDAKLRTS